MSLVALVALGFASKTLAVSFPFQKIEVKYSDGTASRVDIKSDGSFTVPGPLKAGTYTFTLIKGITPVQTSSQIGTENGKSSAISSSSGGDNPMESVSVSKITIYLHVIAPPDPATGATTGKRQHTTLSIMKVTDAASPNLFSRAASSTVLVGTGKIDEDCNGFTGKIKFTYTHGSKTGTDDWTN